MLKMQRWEIWDADVPYEENPNKSKIRPVLIIAPGVCLVLKMTSHQDSSAPRPFEYEIARWKEANLSKPTFVVCDRYIQLPEDRFKGGARGRLTILDIKGLTDMMRYHGLTID